MWKRRTFHECAEELKMVSRAFRRAYTDNSLIDSTNRIRSLQESSQKGIGISRILALLIRSEQDFGNLPKKSITVGALKNAVNEN